ncbi:DNA-binding protein [Aviadenovirus phalacrocoracidae]|uniref:DNA-binding protein n=1 Tax=Aviadenovirus sp. TaxID=2217649 RepID=A0ABZ0T2D8_9ADEN|nr:DNA-binding protein [Aviadenovirus sp.]
MEDEYREKSFSNTETPKRGLERGRRMERGNRMKRSREPGSEGEERIDLVPSSKKSSQYTGRKISTSAVTGGKRDSKVGSRRARPPAELRRVRDDEDIITSDEDTQERDVDEEVDEVVIDEGTDIGESDREDGDVAPTCSSLRNARDNHLEFAAQRAMSYVEKLCDALDVKWQGVTIQPDNAVWSKLGGTYVRKKHPDYRLTFSTFDSFHNQIGRFLAAMVYNKAELEPKFVPGGAHVWRHGWFDKYDAEVPRCLHGMEMVIKPRTVELNPTSEAGKRALAEQNGQIDKNRFGRQIVVLRFDQNAVCYKDAKHTGFPHPHAQGSCAMSFSDAQKALSAMKHDLEWTSAIYPNADQKTAEERILICTSCCCNYAVEAPISGRQTCRMTAYKLSGTDNIGSEMCRQRKDMRAHKSNPNTMVFTCCNPQAPNGGGGRASKKNEKTCGWRISSMDLRYAYVFANELFAHVFGKPHPTNVPEFKWNDSFAFKTDVITPVEPLDSVDMFA